MDFHAPFSGYYPGGGQAQEGGRGVPIKQAGVRHNTTVQIKWHLAHMRVAARPAGERAG